MFGPETVEAPLLGGGLPQLGVVRGKRAYHSLQSLVGLGPGILFAPPPENFLQVINEVGALPRVTVVRWRGQ